MNWTKKFELFYLCKIVFLFFESVKFYRPILFLDVFQSNFSFDSLKMLEFHF